MKPTARETKPDAVDTRAELILKSLREARKAAAKCAKMHQVPLIYMREGKIVREHQ